jgi:hypothetical protein
VVTPEVVKDPKANLKKILDNPEDPELVARYEKVFEAEKTATKKAILDREVRYRENYGPAFTEERVDLVVSWHLLSGMDLDGIFEEIVSMIGEVKAYESNFLDKKKIPIRFAEDAVDEILHRAVTKGESVTDICQQVSADYDYALKLIMDKTGEQEFIITREAIEDPETFINELIRRSYGSGHFAIPGPKNK